MQKYSDAIRSAAQEHRPEWQQIRGWIERFICGTSVMQNVVGQRDHPDGGKVTQAQFDAGARVAHVCPFLIDSIERDLFYIEESPLTDLRQIRKLLTARMNDFKQAEPAYDPIAAGQLAAMPVGLKALLIFFPQYQQTFCGPDPYVDEIFKWMIIRFLRDGLILGQFYKGCEEPAVHNPQWKKVLTAPYLAWVVRYLQPHDSAFIKPGSTGHPIYASLLPVAQAKKL